MRRSWALLFALAACRCATGPSPEADSTRTASETAALPEPKAGPAVVETREGCGGECPGWSQLGFPWHESFIEDVAISADGTTVASVSLDGTLRIWKGDALQPHHVFVVPTGNDDAHLALSADGGRLGYVRGSTLQWFDLRQGRRDGAPERFAAPLVALLPVRGSDAFVVALQDGTVRGPEGCSLALERKVVTAAVDDRGERIAISHNAEQGPHMEFGAVAIFDLGSGKRLVDVKTHHAGEQPHPSAILMPAYHLAFSPDGKQVAGGGYGLQVWNAETGMLEADAGWEGNTFEGKVTELGFTPDGKAVTFIADLAVPVRMALHANKPERTFEDTVTGRELARSESRVVLGSGDGTLRLFDRGTNRQLAVAEGPSAGVVALGFSPDATRLLVGQSDGALLELPLDGAEPRSHAAHADEINGLVVAAEAGLLVTGAHDGSLRAWKVDTLAPAATITERGAPVFTLTQCGAGLVVAGRADGTVDRIELDPPRLADTWTAHGKEVTGVACNKDATHIATVSEDGSGKLWSADGTLLGTLRAPEGKRAYQAVVFVTGDESGSEAILTGEAFLSGDALRRWTIPERGDPSPTSIATLKLGVTRLTTMPGADAIVGANLDSGGATIWNAKDGSVVASLPGSGGTTMAVAVSADGKAIATGTTGNERAVRVWRR